MAVVQSQTAEAWPVEPSLAEERIMLSGVSWGFYAACLKEFQDGGPRLTFDQGVLEIMTPSEAHERFKRLIGRMIEAMTEELGIPIRSLGSTTARRRTKQRGFEPDESYYVASEPRVRGRKTLNPAANPPDLVLEIDITSSSLDKLEVFAAFKVPEVWRYNGRELRVYALTPEGQYAQSLQSPSFPFLPLAEFERFLARRDESDETTWIRAFRAWVRETLGSA